MSPTFPNSSVFKGSSLIEKKIWCRAILKNIGFDGSVIRSAPRSRFCIKLPCYWLHLRDREETDRLLRHTWHGMEPHLNKDTPSLASEALLHFQHFVLSLDSFLQQNVASRLIGYPMFASWDYSGSDYHKMRSQMNVLQQRRGLKLQSVSQFWSHKNGVSAASEKNFDVAKLQICTSATYPESFATIRARFRKSRVPSYDLALYTWPCRELLYIMWGAESLNERRRGTEQEFSKSNLAGLNGSSGRYYRQMVSLTVLLKRSSVLKAPVCLQHSLVTLTRLNKA